MSKNKKRALAYVRSASVIEADQTSLDSQSSEIVRLANEMDYGIDPADVLREVASGASLDRPQLNKVRLMAATGEFDVLFVYSPARLSRTLVDLLMLMREFASHGVEVHFVQGPSAFAPWAFAPWAEFINAVIELCANQERCKHRERTVRGMDAVARSGPMPTGVHAQPFGYDLDPATMKRVFNEVEAEVVVRVFGLYAEGLNISGIVEMLNGEGVKTKTGKAWSRPGLHRMLSNTSYMGVDHYGKTRTVGGCRGNGKRVAAPREEWIEMSGYTPPIISKEMFQKVQERLGEAQARFRGG